MFDGLRIPLHDDEIPNTPSTETPCLCLLEDDSLVTNVGIETGRLLGPLDSYEKLTDVDLSIHVTIKALHVTGSNVTLL